MIISHEQNAETYDASTFLAASDVQVVAERRSQQSFNALSRYQKQGGNEDVCVEWMGSRSVIPGGNRSRHFGARTNGAIEGRQRGTYFQRRRGATLQGYQLAGWLPSGAGRPVCSQRNCCSRIVREGLRQYR